MQGIYKIVNRVNGKYYVGSSTGVERRWREHQKWLDKGAHRNSCLQDAWNEYGGDSFEFRFVENVVGAFETVLIREQTYLDAGFAANMLYNIAKRAGRPSFAGKCHTEETKRQMSRAGRGRIKSKKECQRLSEAKKRYYEAHDAWNKGVPRSPECIQKLRKAGKRYFETHEVWNKGKIGLWTHTAEAKHRMSESRRGRRHTAETLRRMSESKKGKKNPFYGKTHTKEARRKMGDATRGKPKTKEHCDKIAQPYPAFYNDQTDEYIPPGRNLRGMCRERNLNCDVFGCLRRGDTKQSKDGWRLAE